MKVESVLNCARFDQLRGGERKASMNIRNAPSWVVGPLRSRIEPQADFFRGAASSFSFSYLFAFCMIHFPIDACSVCAYAWIYFAALLQIDRMPIDRCTCKVFSCWAINREYIFSLLSYRYHTSTLESMEHDK